jgi:hypothetical protein
VISYPDRLVQIGGARTGIAPVNLLDVLTVNNEAFYFSDRPSTAPPAITNIAPTSIDFPVPFPIPAGQAVAWALPGTADSGDGGGPGSHGGTDFGGTINGHASADLTSGDIGMIHSCSLCNWNWFARWYGFTMPAIPAGAIIQGIYPTMEAIEWDPTGNFNSSYGGGAAAGVVSPWGVSVGTSVDMNGPPPSTVQSSLYGTYHTTSIGNTEAAVLAAQMYVRFFQTLGIAGDGNLRVRNPRLAIYYSLPTDTGGEDEGLLIARGPYRPWLISIPQLKFHRSLQTDIGSFILQNLSGDSLSRDWEKLMRRSTFEGAFFIYRMWQPDAEAAWLEMHGSLTVEDVNRETISLKGSQLIDASQTDSNQEMFSETCQWEWASKRCGATGSVECKYSYPTCQVIEHFSGVLNTYEKNYGQADATLAQKLINRRRKI